MMILPVHASGLRALDLQDPMFRLVVQRPLSGVQTQQWTVFNRPGFPLSDDFMIDNAISGFFEIQVPSGAVARGGLVLDVVNGTRNPGDAIQVHAPHFGPNQLWEIWTSEAYPEGFS